MKTGSIVAIAAAVLFALTLLAAQEPKGKGSPAGSVTDEIKALLASADDLYNGKKYDLAEQAYMKVLEKDPKNVQALMSIGHCYQDRGNPAKALAWYGKIDPGTIDDPIVLYNIGTDYYNNSRFEEAWKYYRKAVDSQKDFADGLYQLGLSGLNLQKNAEAAAAFESYLKIDPDSPRAAQVRAFLDYLKKK